MEPGSGRGAEEKSKTMQKNPPPADGEAEEAPNVQAGDDGRTGAPASSPPAGGQASEAPARRKASGRVVRRFSKAAPPIRRDIAVGPMLTMLRWSVGLPPHETAPGELAVVRGRTLPSRVNGVDTGAWVAWSAAGLLLFSRKPYPSIKEVLTEARRVLLCLVVERMGGNITHSAALLRTSRRAMRTHLRAAGAEPESDCWTMDDVQYSGGAIVPASMTGEDSDGGDEPDGNA